MALLNWLLDHPGLLLSAASSAVALLWVYLQRVDAVALARLEALPLFHAHPDAAALLERGNALVMGALREALTLALRDATAASAWNETLADKIAADVLAQLRTEFGLPAVARAAVAVGGEGKLLGQFSGAAKVFIKAPSGRRVVELAPTPA
jgi:hypothetical protein